MLDNFVDGKVAGVAKILTNAVCGKEEMTLRMSHRVGTYGQVSRRAVLPVRLMMPVL